MVVNAVTKSGTNQFKGVVFLSAASNALTSEDFLVKQGNLTKPTTTKRDWGGVSAGRSFRNKAHFFASLERQVDNPTRTRVFPTRPSLNFSIGRGALGLEYAGPLRPPDQRPAHLGDPVPEGGRAAVPDRRDSSDA